MLGATVLVGGFALLLFGLALLIATRLIVSGNPTSDGTVELSLKLIAAVMIAIGLFGVLVILVGVAGIIIWLAAGVVTAMTLVQLRIIQQRALLDLLALGAEKRLPLTSVVKAFAADQPNGGPPRLTEFAADLQAGTSLGKALVRTPSVLPRQAVVAAQLGEDCGKLDIALRSVARSYTFGLPLRQALVGRIFYLAWMLFMIPMVFTFITIKILPAYVRIFEDFEVEMPSMTLFVFKVLHNDVVLWIAGFAPLLGTLASAYVLLYYIGVVPAPTFGLGFWAERAKVLRALSLAVESNLPLAEALDRLAEGYPSRSVSRRLHAASVDVAAGSDWTQTFLRHGLIGKSAAAVVQSAQRVGNLPWALGQVAQASERRLVYRLEAALNILSPLVVLALGAVVSLFVVGCFLPLVKLINSLT